MAHAMGAQIPGFKVEQIDSASLGEGARIKVEPPSTAASPAEHSDEDIYEDAGDLDFSHTVQGLYLSRIPKYLWEAWSKIGDDEEIQLGTIRVEGGLDDIKRMSLLLDPNSKDQMNVPKEYNMHVAHRSSSNTFIFTEKNLNGYLAKDKPGTQSKISGNAFPSQAIKHTYQNRPGQKSPQREITRRWQPYKTIPKQTVLIGQIQTEINCLPVENSEYKRTMDARTREALTKKPKRETQMVEKEPKGKVYTPTGGQQHNSFEVGFTKQQTKPAAGKAQHYKAARLPENEVKDLIFDCFKRYTYWPMKVLKKELEQPEIYLRQVLETIADLIKSGQYANSWQLKSGFQESNYDVNVKDEAAPDADYPDGPDLEDDEENMKMEDVLPS